MPRYNVHIELDKRDPSTEYLEQLLEATQQLHAAVGTSPRGWVDVQLTILAEDVRQAFQLAVAAIQQETGATAIAVEVMTEAEFNARQGFTDMPELVSVSEAADMLGVSRQRILQMIDERRFPTASKVGSTTVIARSDVTGKLLHAVFVPNDSVGSAWIGPVPRGDDDMPLLRVTDPQTQEGGVAPGTWVFDGIELRNGSANYHLA